MTDISPQAPACKNCKFYSAPSLFTPLVVPFLLGDTPDCGHPSRKTHDPVFGSTILYRGCRKARADVTDCGPRGRLFVPSLRHKIVTALFGRGE